MPRKTKTTAAAEKAAQPQIPAELLEQLIPGPVTPAQFEDIFQRFKKAFMERALGAEMSQHLGYEAGQAKPAGTTNHRNGKSAKTVLTDTGALAIGVPRDRHASFEPQLIGKHERRFTGFDDKIIAMYARAMTVREIQGFLAEMYSVDVSPDLISSVTDAVMGEVTTWQSRPLEAMYPVVFFDALRVKIREDAVVRNKAVYLALGVLPDGTRDILGLWIENTEGAKFWMKVFNDQKTRGVNDILIAVTDGLKGMPKALQAVFPATTLQTCIVHLIRNSLAYASWKDRKTLAAAIKPIYTAASAQAAQAELRGGAGNLNTAISGNSAPTKRASSPGKQKDHEQETASQSLLDLQGQGGFGRHSRREDPGRASQGARRAPQPDRRLEEPVARARGQRVRYRIDERAAR